MLSWRAGARNAVGGDGIAQETNNQLLNSTKVVADTNLFASLFGLYRSF